MKLRLFANIFNRYLLTGIHPNPLQPMHLDPPDSCEQLRFYDILTTNFYYNDRTYMLDGFPDNVTVNTITFERWMKLRCDNNNNYGAISYRVAFTAHSK